MRLVGHLKKLEAAAVRTLELETMGQVRACQTKRRQQCPLLGAVNMIQAGSRRLRMSALDTLSSSIIHRVHGCTAIYRLFSDGTAVDHQSRRHHSAGIERS